MTVDSENSTSKPRGRIKKFVSIAAVVLLVVGVLAEVAWTYWGSGQWQLESDEDGVKVYSMKTPGSGLKKFKGVVMVHSSMNTLVALMTDPTLCKDLGCHDWRVIERSSQPHSLTLYTTSQFDLPFNLSTREYVSRETYSQDPTSKAVTYEIAATPDKIPPNGCCVRVTHMMNVWRYAPVAGDEVRVEYFMDMDERGFIPDLMKNYFHPMFLAGYLSGLQSMIDKEKKENRTVDFIDEPG